MPAEQPFLESLDDILSTNRGMNWLYSTKALGVDSPSLMLDSVDNDPPYVDRSAVSVRARISNAEPDRVGDVLLASGCKLDNYRLNPVVLWNHGLTEGIPLPMGTSSDPDGNLAIQIIDDSVYGTCFFAQKDQTAMQVFELIADGVIRGVSVRETPLKSRPVFKNGRTITEVSLWDLEEWSFTVLGVNPQAITKCLSKNRLDGRPIHESIYKSLTAIAPKPKKYGTGFEESKMKKDDMGDDNVPEDKENSETGSTGSGKTDNQNPATIPADQATESNVNNGATMQAPENEPGVDPAKQPYGSQVIKCLHAHIKSGVKSTNSCLGDHLENEAVKKGVGDVNDMMKAGMTQLEGLHVKCYPKMKCDLKSEDMGDETEDSSDDDNTEMKSFLAASSGRQNEMYGIIHRLKSLQSDKNLNGSQRKSLQSTIDHAERLVRQAEIHGAKMKSMTPKVEESKPAMAPEDEKMRKLAEELQRRLSAS